MECQVRYSFEVPFVQNWYVAPQEEWTEEEVDESRALVDLSIDQNNRRSYYKDALEKDVNVRWFTLKMAKERDFHRIA